MSGAGPSRVLVTGGSGLVGGEIVRSLAAAGYALRVLSRRDQPVSTPVFEPVRGDLTSQVEVRRAVEGCEVVFHCAAETRDESRMQAANVEGTRNLLEACRAVGIRRFCHLSSVGVVGKVDRRVVDESTPCRPMNRYEETKLLAEQIVAEGIHGASVAIVRPTNVFGPDSVAALQDSSAAARLRLALRARECAHFVYVKDVAAAAIFLALRHDAPSRDIAIVSSDHEPGNTHAEIQQAIVAMRPRAPRAIVAAPRFVPRLLRRLRGVSVNRDDVEYSSAHLRAAGFAFPFGLREGLRDALNG